MQLRTYTGLWNVEKRLYKFYDVKLPYPVSLRQIATLLAIAVPWMILMSLVHMPMANPGDLVWFGPPVILTVVANRPVADGKKLPDFLLSQVRYFFSPRKYNDLYSDESGAGTKMFIKAQVWRRF